MFFSPRIGWRRFAAPASASVRPSTPCISVADNGTTESRKQSKNEAFHGSREQCTRGRRELSCLADGVQPHELSREMQRTKPSCTTLSLGTRRWPQFSNKGIQHTWVPLWPWRSRCGTSEPRFGRTIKAVRDAASRPHVPSEVKKQLVAQYPL